MSLPLPVTVTVDPTSGRWSVDGVPMILVPQHLLTGVLTAAEEYAGVPSATDVLRTAGYQAARRWCEIQAARRSLGGTDLVRYYLEQLGSRGWGRFTILDIDLATRHIDVRVDDSAFATRRVASPISGACYPFAGWLEGAVDYAADLVAPSGLNRQVMEHRCVASGADHCRFRSLPPRAA